MEEALLEILARLEAVAPHVWALAVRQVWVDAVIGSIIGIICFAVTQRVFVWARREAQRNKHDAPMYWILFGCCAFFVDGIGLALFNDVLQALLNPQWQAIQKIINLVP